MRLSGTKYKRKMTEEKVKEVIYRMVVDGTVSRAMLHYPSDIKSIIDELERNGLR